MISFEKMKVFLAASADFFKFLNKEFMPYLYIPLLVLIGMAVIGVFVLDVAL